MSRRPLRGARRASLALAVLLHAALAPGVAAAQPAESEGEAHVRQGVELRRAGRNGEALVEFQKAYALEPSPRAKAQIGLALQALGDWLGAERWLEEAMQARDDAWIDRYRATLSGALGTIQAHLGRVFVDADVGEGEVLVNGAVARTLPSAEAIRVVAGTVDVVVRSPGRVEARRRIDVAPGAEVRASFSLERVAPVMTPDPRTLRPSIEADVPAHARSALGGVVALGAAGALAVGGAVAWKVRQDDAAVWNDDSRCLVAGAGSRGQQCGGYQTGANVASVLAVSAFTAAAAGAAIGAWLLWPVRPDGGRSASWCAPRALGVACGASF